MIEKSIILNLRHNKVGRHINFEKTVTERRGQTPPPQAYVISN